MQPSCWRPPMALSTQEEQMVARIRHAKLFVFLHQHRHELFDDAFQQELATLYRTSKRGHPPIAPAQLALAVMLQAYTGVSDDEVIEATLMISSAFFQAPDDGRDEIFGPSNGPDFVEMTGSPLLAQLPIDPVLTSLCDAGRVEEYLSDAYELLATNAREYAENQTLIEQKGLTLINFYERQTFFTGIEQSQWCSQKCMNHMVPLLFQHLIAENHYSRMQRLCFQ